MMMSSPSTFNGAQDLHENLLSINYLEMLYFLAIKSNELN